MNPNHDRIWAYLHDELSPADRKRFERALDNDPHLLQAFLERKQNHLLLLEARAAAEELVDALIKKWEADHPEYIEKPASSLRTAIRLGLPLTATAAAVGLLLRYGWPMLNP